MLKLFLLPFRLKKVTFVAMNTFETGIYNENIDFEYQAGTVITKNAWEQPTNDILNKFLKTIPKIKNYHKYELFLVGGVVNGNIGKTWVSVNTQVFKYF